MTLLDGKDPESNKNLVFEVTTAGTLSQKEEFEILRVPVDFTGNANISNEKCIAEALGGNITVKSKACVIIYNFFVPVIVVSS